MAGIDNLNPVRTKSEARARGALGGKASGAARRRKKALRELADAFGAARPTANDCEVLAQLGLSEGDMTNDMAVVAALYGKAKQGDVAAFNAIRDIKGEKPTDNIAVDFPKKLTVEVIDAGAPMASSEDEITR